MALELKVKSSAVYDECTDLSSTSGATSSDPSTVLSLLSSINEMQLADSNAKNLHKVGGIDALAKLLVTDMTKGLSSAQVVKNRTIFGDNTMPEAPMKYFIVLFIESFNDVILLVLIGASIISLVLGIWGPHADQEPYGWIEGAAIMIAVFIVAIVTAGNDYTKELQFRALAKFAATLESCTVLRDGGARKILNPRELVVGDIISLKGGDQIFADAVLFECDAKSGLAMDEAALTGESELVKKNSVAGGVAHHDKEPTDIDPFLLSSTVCSTHGNAEDAKAIVIGVGAASQWGRIKANLEQEERNTPLQDKLEDMVLLIGYLGAGAAILTFLVTIIYIATSDPSDRDWLDGVMDAFIIAITIIVVAIPEGLPLAVTISLAYSMKKMTIDNNLVKTLAACETMGNATNICSDKTGTLTEGRMALVEGWFADEFVRENSFPSWAGNFTIGNVFSDPAGCGGQGSWATKAGNPTNWLEPLLQNIGINSLGEVTYGFEYFAPPKDKTPVCLPWAFDKEKEKTPIPADWGEDRLKEARFMQIRKDRPDHFNMTELALLSFAHRMDFDTIAAKKNNKVLKLVPFNSKVKYSAAVIELNKNPQNDGPMLRLLVKGAPEIVVTFCSSYSSNQEGKSLPLNDAKRGELSTAQDAMSATQKRVICLAHRDISLQKALNGKAATIEELSDEDLAAVLNSDLTVDAFVGIIDPLRPDVPASVRVAQNAGVKVRMVTGDNLKTASAIADKAGIFKTGDIAMEGPEFRKLTPSQLDEMLPRLTVLARSAPEDKYLLVTRLNGKNIPKDQAEWEAQHPDADWHKDRDLLLPGYKDEWDLAHPGGGDIVGVTGDGTNDAPALKAADVGLAMNSGTAVAKEASDIVILDDNFSSIVSSIKWGRCVYDNIRKFLQFQLTVNVVALLLVFIAALSGEKDPPLNAVQMLWVNLIMDTMGALALGTEQPTDELLERPPYKRDAFLVNKPMIRNILAQSTFQLILLLLLLYMGHIWFNVNKGNTCKEYKSSGNALWDWNIDGKYVGNNLGEAGCDTFLKGLLADGTSPEQYEDLDCSSDLSYTCLKKEYEDFDHVNDGHKTFESACLICKEDDYTHYTLIFNAFVFCQIFNEFNARSITDEWNVFAGVSTNPVFCLVIFVTIVLQILLVQYTGVFTKTSPLSVSQWLITCAMGSISLPVGVLMRCIPVDEDPEDFASSLDDE